MTSSVTRRRRWPLVLLGLVALVFALGWFALSRLDAFLLTRVRAETDAYALRLGRPITLEGISTRLFPRVGATVEGLRVGPAEGEELDLLSLGSVDVDVSARPLLASRGRDIRVERVEARGLEVQVVRFADGTTNVSRLLERQASTAPPEEAPDAGEGAPLDLSRVHLERAALVDGIVRLVDRSGATPATWAINDLDVEIRDVQVGKAIKLELSAGVLAEQQNLEFSLTTSPLTASLDAIPESLHLKLKPLDLAPLAPFLGDSGLLGGRLEADLEAALGNAVPGGKGPTRLKGGLKASALRFQGAEGGKALDVELDTDVQGDVGLGNLTLDTLVLRAGPAKITGSGRLEGVLGDAPRFEGFRLVGEGLDPQALAAYWPPLKASVANQVAGPVGLDVRGSGDAAGQQLQAVIDLTPVRLAIPGQLKKAAGAPLRLTASASGAAAGGGPLRFEARLHGDGADLRPGELLDKAPGERLEVQAAGTFTPAGKAGTWVVDVPRLALSAKADTLTGSARYTGGGKLTDFALDLKGPRLDVDALLLDDAETAAQQGQVATPKNDARRFDGYRGDIRLAIDALRFKDVDLRALRAKLKMVDDRIAVEQFETQVFGGTVSAGGSSVALGPLPEQRPFSAKVKLTDIDVARALAMTTDKKMLAGRFTGEVDLSGKGYDMDALQERLAGSLQGELVQGSLLGIDVVGSVAKPLASALPFGAKKFDVGDVTQLAADLPLGVTIQQGVAQLKRPITWTRPGQAQLHFDGGMRLDGTLALDGRVSLAPEFLQALTANRVRPTAPIPLDLKLTGPAWKPRVEGLDVMPAAQALIKMAAGSAAQQLLGKERSEALEKVVGGGLKETQDKARQEAEERVARERARVEQEARDKAAVEKRKVEEAAKNKLKGIFGR